MTLFARLAILPPMVFGVVLVWHAVATELSPPTVMLPERRVPISYVTTAPRDFTPTVTAYGTVAPARVWTAVAQVAGLVLYRNPAFVRGGFVREGDVLVRLAADDYVLALQRAAADLAAAEANLKEAQNSSHTTRASLEIEREALALADADHARAANLVKKGAVSPAVVEERHRSVLTQRSKVQTHENALALLPTQVGALEAAVAAAQAAHAAAALDVSRTVVKAPFDARVARLDVEVSQFVGVGTAIGTLDGVAAAEIDVAVPQNQITALARVAVHAPATGEDAGSLPAAKRAAIHHTSASSTRGNNPDHAHRLSARVHLNLGEREARWPATVMRLSDTVSAETRSVGVILHVDAPYAATEAEQQTPLIKGMFVRADLSGPPASGVILLPRAAIRNGQVMIAGPDDRLTYAPAAPIFVSHDIAVLAPGSLTLGTRVITSNTSPAIEGLLLDPEPDRAAEARLAAAAKGNPH